MSRHVCKDRRTQKFSRKRRGRKSGGGPALPYSMYDTARQHLGPRLGSQSKNRREPPPIQLSAALATHAAHCIPRSITAPPSLASSTGTEHHSRLASTQHNRISLSLSRFPPNRPQAQQRSTVQTHDAANNTPFAIRHLHGQTQSKPDQSRLHSRPSVPYDKSSDAVQDYPTFASSPPTQNALYASTPSRRLVRK